MTYIDHHAEPHYVAGKAPDFGVSHSWHDFTQARLRWLYGDRHSIDRRAAADADVAAWNRLGRGKAAA